MLNHGKYPDELRERAVRMVLEHGHEYGSQWEARRLGRLEERFVK
jgi:transposase-like protein